MSFSRDNFHVAARDGDIEAVKKYINANRDNPRAIIAADEFDQTALYYAASSGHTESVRELLNVDGISTCVDKLNDVGITPLGAAASGGHTDIVNLLINFGAHVDRRGESANTPLMHAVVAGSIDTVKSLLNAGADVNATGRNYDTPLIKAVFHQRTDITKLLLSAPGINLHAKNIDDRTAAEEADILGRNEIHRLIVAAERKALSHSNRSGATKFKLFGKSESTTSHDSQPELTEQNSEKKSGSCSTQ